MAGGDDALTQLHHVRTLQDGAEFGLADQERLEHGLRAELEVRQHAQFLDGALRQVLRLIHDEQAALAPGCRRHEEGFQRHQQIGLARTLGAHAEGGGDHRKNVFGIELGADQVRRLHTLGVKAFQQVAHDGGLAGADIAGDDDEAFVLVHAVLEVGHGAAMLLAAEIELRIGIELERLAGQAIEGLIHEC